jgi:outer membrane protein insertion porin family
MIGFALSASAEEPARVRGVSLTGVVDLPFEEARRIIAVRPGELYTPALCQRAIERMIKRYRLMGYSRVEVGCALGEIYHRTNRADLEVKVIEGEPDRIRRVRLQGGLPEGLQERILSSLSENRGRIYSETQKKELQQDVLFRLRREGYFLASASVSYSEGDLIVEILLREPFKVEFSGNRVISDRELAEAAGFRERLTPFSRRSISRVRELIIEEYERRGYLFVAVEIQEIGDDQVVLQIDEGVKTRLRSLTIEGNAQLTDGEIREVMSLKPRRFWPLSFLSPGLVTRAMIVRDLLAIEELYRSRGFHDVNARVDPFAQTPELDLRILVAEGGQARIKQLELVADCDLGQKLLGEKLSDLSGSIAVDEVVGLRKRVLREGLNRAGYVEPQIEIRLARETGTLQGAVQCGSRHSIRKVYLAGLRNTSEDLVQGLIGELEGDFWDETRLREIQSELRRSGLFSSVTMEPVDGGLDSSNEDLLITVVERDTGVLDTSLSFNTEDGFRLGGELSQRNILGRGQTVALLADLFINDGPDLFDAGRARAFHRFPRFMEVTGLELLSEAYAQFDIQTVNLFNFSRVGVDSQLRYQAERTILSGGISVFQDDISEVSPDVIVTDRDEGETFYSYLVGRVEYEGRDSTLAPTKGLYASLLGRVASESWGSDLSVASMTFEIRYLQPLETNVIWANGFRGVLIEPFGDSDVIPISQRLFLGGSNSLRGFNRNSLSPLGVEGGRAGGDREYVLNSELQLNLPSELQLAVFVDAGEVKIANGGQTLSSRTSDFRISPGFGVRYRLPVGAIGVDLGFPVEGRQGESSPRIYVGFNGVF